MISSKKAIAGLLLIIGLPVIVFAALESRHAHRDAGATPKQAAALMVLGLVPMGIGGFMLWGMYDNERRNERDRLRTVFFQLVKAGRGRISATDFSIETGLTPNDAKQYLDNRARYFQSICQMDEDHGIVYQFQLGLANPALLTEEQTEEKTEEQREPDGDPLTFSVFLHTIPPEHEEAIQQALQDIMDVVPDTITELPKDGARDLRPIQTGVPLAIAQDYRQRLEAAGATVIVALE